MTNKSKISHSLEDYLEAVLILELEHGGARVKDIADLLSVKMPSVNTAIAQLKDTGLVDQEPYGAVTVTKEGKKVAAAILRKHKFLTNFFINLGVDPEQAEKDACNIEHVISDATFQKLVEHCESHMSGCCEEEII